MREKHRENGEMRKTGRERLVVSSRTDAGFTAVHRGTGFEPFTPQLSTDVPQFANYSGVCILRMISLDLFI